MGERVKVDTDRLRRTGAGLGHIASELAEGEIGLEGLRSDAGFARLHEALEDEQGRWRVRRGRLVEDLRALERMADQSAVAFERAETTLTAAVPGSRR